MEEKLKLQGLISLVKNIRVCPRPDRKDYIFAKLIVLDSLNDCGTFSVEPTANS
jgi:hypothetical protein